MVRVRDLWAEGSWFESRYERIVPDGLVSHWTRPMDALISLCAFPFTLFMAREAALFWGGYVVSPVLGVVTALILALALRPVLTRVQTVMTTVSLVCAAPILATFIPGRPDHYSVLLPVIAVIVWGLVLMVTTPRWRRGAALVGIALPLALWVNISGVLVALMVPVVLGVRWLFSGTIWSACNQRVSAWASATCLAILFVERPPWDALTVVEFDRVSLWHLCVFLAMVLFWSAVRGLERARPSIVDHGPLARLVPAVPLAALGVGALLLAFPQVLAPDHGIPVDPLYASLRMSRIVEYQPLLTAADFGGVSALLTAVGAHAAFLLPSLLATAGMLILLAATTPDRRWLWGSLLGVAAACVLLTWPPVPAWTPMILILLLPGHGLIAAMALLAFPDARPLIRVPMRAVLTSAVLVGPIIIQASPYISDKVDRQTVLTRCSATDLIRWLGTALPPSPPLNIMAPADLGAELMYRTPHNVYAIPNHRFQPGFASRVAVISAPTDAEARARVTAAEADVLVICGAEVDADPPDQTRPAPAFKTRLLAGDVPNWLTPLPAPDAVNDAVRVFRVRRDQD